MQKIFVWIGGKAAVIVAISSMIIAGLSLYFAIEAQKTDKEYREVSIQPRIMLNAQNDDFAWNIRNAGLGPGVVAEIVMKVDGKCISSSNFDVDEWNAKFTQFVKEMQFEMFSKALPPMPWIKGGKKTFNTEADALVEEDVISAGEVRWIIRLDPEVTKELKQLQSDQLFAAKQIFAERAYAAPFAVRLCSATGRTCGTVGNAAGCANADLGR